MTGRQAALLVARREFTERARDRSFLISTLVTLLVVGVVALLAGLLDGDGGESYRIGAEEPEALAIARMARAVGPGFDVRIDVRRGGGEQAARTAVDEESLDAALLAGGTVVSKGDLPGDLRQALETAAARVRGAARLRSEGLSDAEARAALDPPPLRIRPLEGSGDGGERRGIALAASFLLYGQLIVYGMWIAMGVVEEKSSRVVEVLLSSLRARSLLAGKLLGLGALGLCQLFVAGLVGLVIAAASGAVELDGPTVATLGTVLVWFVFGYALYAALYATAAVLVSRQEDLQSSTTPLTVVIVLAFLLVFPALDDPSGTVATVGSVVPLSSPIVMPGRIALGEATTLEIAASLVLLAGSVALLIPLAARIYEGAVLRIGRPLHLVEAWRAPRA